MSRSSKKFVVPHAVQTMGPLGTFTLPEGNYLVVGDDGSSVSVHLSDGIHTFDVTNAAWQLLKSSGHAVSSDR